MKKKKLPISKKTVLIASTLVLLVGLPIAYYLWGSDPEDTSAWFNSSWLYRRSITVADPGSTQSNAELLLIIDTATLISGNKLQSDCDDLRVVDSDDSTTLTYWVEGGCNTSTTHIWVKIPTLTAGGKTIYLYYGNDSATNSEETWTGKFILLKDSSCDPGWTTESESDRNFFERFPLGSSSYGTLGGSARHTHQNTTLQTDSSAISQNVNKGSGNSMALDHYHTVTITMNPSSHDILPPYLDMMFCSNTDLIVKQNTVSLFDATLPSGFTRFTPLDDKFPRGNSTYGGSSSATTHTHTLNSVTTAGPSITSTCTSGTTQVPTSTHTHLVSSSTSGSGVMLPEYIAMIFGQADADTMAPAGTIIMSSALPPMGWSHFSPLTDKFPYGSSTYGTTGGSKTHTHSVNATTEDQSATVECSTDLPKTTGILTHTHTVTGDLNTASNNPPYIQTIYIKKNASMSATINNEETPSTTLNTPNTSTTEGKTQTPSSLGVNSFNHSNDTGGSVLGGQSPPIYLNSVPNAPSTPYTEGSTNPVKVTDTLPEFSAVFTDIDPADTANSYQIQVSTTNTFGMEDILWDSTKTDFATPLTNGSRSDPIEYGSTPLALNGKTYYWRIKFWDNDNTESSWSSTAHFTMSGPPVAPTNLKTDGMSNPSQIHSLTPAFRAHHLDPNGDSAEYYEIEVNTQSDFLGTVMWDSNKSAMTSTPSNQYIPDVTYAGTALSGDSSTTYYWRIRLWDSDGNVSAWSPVATFTDNVEPVDYFQVSGVGLEGISFN